VFFISRRLHAQGLLLIYLVFTVSDRSRLGAIIMHLRLALLLCLVALLYLIAQISAAAAQVGSSTPVSNSSYNFGDVLTLSALGGQVPSFTPLSIWNFTDGWLEPWVPPPNGELHLQRGGWVNTIPGFSAVNWIRLFLLTRELIAHAMNTSEQ